MPSWGKKGGKEFSGFVIAAFALDGFPFPCSLGERRKKMKIPYTIDVCYVSLLLLLLTTVFSVHSLNHRLTGIHGKGQFNFLCETSLFEGKRTMLLGFFSQSTAALRSHIIPVPVHKR